MGINVEVVNTGTIFSDVRKVLRIVREEGYELIHSHGAKANMIAVLVKSLPGFPWLLQFTATTGLIICKISLKCSPSAL